MPRGHGITQRRALALLDLGATGTTIEIAKVIYGGPPTVPERHATSRALRRLLATGFVEVSDGVWRRRR